LVNRAQLRFGRFAPRYPPHGVTHPRTTTSSSSAQLTLAQRRLCP